MSAPKNIIRMFGPQSSGVLFELRWIRLGWFIIILSCTYFGETSSILQSSGQRHFSIFSWSHFLCFSDYRKYVLYYESVLFHVSYSAFEISTKLAIIVAQWRGQMICNSAIITVKMMKLWLSDYDNDCDTLLCSMFVFFGSMKY